MAAADLLILVPVIIAGVLFLLNTGISMFFKSKLGFIASQAAPFAAQLVATQPSIDPQPQTLALVSDLMKSMGLPTGSGFSVSVTPTTVGGQLAVNVQISDKFPLVAGAQNIFPAAISLQDNATAIVGGTGPELSIPIGFSVTGSPTCVVVPVKAVQPTGTPAPPGSFALSVTVKPLTEVFAVPTSAVAD